VRKGALSEPLPLDAFARLDAIIAEFTPDVFDKSVSEGIAEIERKPETERGPVAVAASPDPSAIAPPPDPIAEIDPARAAQHAKGGAINRIWELLLRGERGAKNIERAEKAVGAYGRYVGPVLQWLLKLGDGG